MFSLCWPLELQGGSKVCRIRRRWQGERPNVANSRGECNALSFRDSHFWVLGRVTSHLSVPGTAEFPWGEGAEKGMNHLYKLALCHNGDNSEKACSCPEMRNPYPVGRSLVDAYLRLLLCSPQKRFIHLFNKYVWNTKHCSRHKSPGPVVFPLLYVCVLVGEEQKWMKTYEINEDGYDKYNGRNKRDWWNRNVGGGACYWVGDGGRLPLRAALEANQWWEEPIMWRSTAGLRGRKERNVGGVSGNQVVFLEELSKGLCECSARKECWSGSSLSNHPV